MPNVKGGQKPLSGHLKCQSPSSVIDTLITGDSLGSPSEQSTLPPHVVPAGGYLPGTSTPYPAHRYSHRMKECSKQGSGGGGDAMGHARRAASSDVRQLSGEGDR